MKKLRANMDRYFDKLEEPWRALPLRRQQKFTLYFFAGYLILTAGVIVKVWHNASKPGNAIAIDHIESPVLKKGESHPRFHDTILTILKENSYERK